MRGFMCIQPSYAQKRPREAKILISWIKRSQRILNEYHGSCWLHSSSAGAQQPQDCVWGSQGQERSPALGGKHRYPLLFWKLPSDWGGPTEAAVRIWVKHKPQRQAASVSFLPSWAVQTHWTDRYLPQKKRPFCVFHHPAQLAGGSDTLQNHAVICIGIEMRQQTRVCYPTLHNTGCEERKWGFWVNHWTSR